MVYCNIWIAYPHTQGEVHKNYLLNLLLKQAFSQSAQDYIEDRVDIFNRIVQKSYIYISSKSKRDSMEGRGIQSGDILVVDKSLLAKNNSIVVAYIDGEFTLRGFLKK